MQPAMVSIKHKKYPKLLNIENFKINKISDFIVLITQII